MMTQTTATAARPRYITLSVPKNDDDGAFWFVYDTRLHRSEEVATYAAAAARVRALNAGR